MADKRKKPHTAPGSRHSVVVDQQEQDAAAAAAGGGLSNSTSTSTDPFLSSMTFASLRREDRISSGCDCDECGFGTTSGGGDNNKSTIPITILQALHRYKKRKLESSPMKRTQNRTLSKRCLATGVAVWTWTMPRGAEPLVEFGNSHRIVWVKRLPEKSIIKSIGRGILGSSQEENDRSVMDGWKEGGVYLVPANGGKAVGWIHEEQLEPTSSSSEQASHQNSSSGISGPVVLVQAKIPMDSLTAATNRDDHAEDGECEPKEAWAKFILNCCAVAFKELGYSSSSTSLSPFQFSEKDAMLLKQNMS